MPTAKKMPAWARKVLLATSIVGPLCAAITTLYVTISDIRTKTKDAKVATVASYDTFAPALQEMQTIIEDMQEWLDEDGESIRSLTEMVHQQEKQIARLEAWIEILGRRSNAPEPVIPVAVSDASPPEPPEKPKTHRPQWRIPDSASGAKALQQQRVKLNCDPEDPLCGGSQ